MNMLDWQLLRKSLEEVFFLTIIAFLPLATVIFVDVIRYGNIENVITTKVLPVEILSYSLSFIVPSIYLLMIKTQGTSYRLPLLHFFSLITVVLYVTAFVLYIGTKNNSVKPEEPDNFLKWTFYYLSLTTIFRIYSVYHGRNMVNYQERRRESQQIFNDGFKDAINNNQ